MKLTQAVAKNPITQHFLRQAQRHHKYPEQEVCQGQGCHKPVLDILQREVGEDGDDDEEVADDDHGHDENADNADEDDLKEGIAGGVALHEVDELIGLIGGVGWVREEGGGIVVLVVA